MQAQKSDVLSLVVAQYDGLSKGQKRIADFIRDHYDKAAFMTALNLGDAAKVSESTVVRFATVLGYDGFPALSGAMQELVRNRLTSQQRISLVESENERQTLLNVLKEDVNNLRSTMTALDPEEFLRFIDRLIQSENIYICGHRSSSVLAQFLEYYLSYVFSGVHLITTGAKDYYDRLTRISGSDTLIAISFPRYSMRTAEVAQIAREKGAHICAITDNAKSPIARIADYRLYAQSSMATFVDSVVAPMSIINAIIVICGQRKRGELEKHFAELEKIWSHYQVYAQTEPPGHAMTKI
jgi:DNA-binding MurR/RpiR family transcriptional regulator